MERRRDITKRYTVESIVKSRSQTRLERIGREDRRRRPECDGAGEGNRDGDGDGEKQIEKQNNETQVLVQNRDRG